MPELPEVETIKRDLEKVIVGKKITEVCVHHSAVVRQPSVERFTKGIEGVVIKNILRRAKVLILELSNGKSLVVHLKMTGQLVYPGDGTRSRVSFHLSNGKNLDFNDQRLFGELHLLDDWRHLKFIQSLGPEPLEVNSGQFKEMLFQENQDQAAVDGPDFYFRYWQYLCRGNSVSGPDSSGKAGQPAFGSRKRIAFKGNQRHLKRSHPLRRLIY